MKVLICTPTHAGECKFNFVQSLVETVQLLTLAGISCQWKCLAFCSFPSFAREQMAREFLETDCTDLIFIDDDIGWEADGLLNLLTKDVDVVGAACPRRKDNGGLVINLLRNQNGQPIEMDGMLECAYLGTGILRIRRSAFARLAGGRFFEATYEGDRPIGEDAWFCREFRRGGGRVWALPGIKTTHAGLHVWRGELDQRI